MSKEKPFVNVLLLGNDFYEKRDFINLFANYLKYDSFLEVLLCEPECRIPTQFYSGRKREKLITIGDIKKVPGSSILRPILPDYIFELENVKLRLINCNFIIRNNTLRIKFHQIISTILPKFGYLNAVVIFDSTADFLLEICENLLPHFDKSACQNVIFISNSGDPQRIWFNNDFMKMKKHNPKEIHSSEQNTFYFDNTFFKYLVFHYRGENVEHISEYHNEDNWKQGSKQCKKFINYIVGDNKCTGLKPQFMKPIKDNLDELFRFLAESACALYENLLILRNTITPMPLLISLEKTISGKCVYVCKSLLCTLVQERATDISNNFCEYANGMESHCTCGCPMDMHHPSKYLKKLPHQHFLSKPTNNTRAPHQDELNAVLDLLINVAAYKIQAQKLTEDPFVFYLDNYKHMDYTNLKELYYKSKCGKEINTIKLEDISKGMEQLKMLKWMGSTIGNIYGNNFDLKSEIAIEKMLETFKQENKSELLFENNTENIHLHLYTSTENNVLALSDIKSNNLKPHTTIKKQSLDANQIQFQLLQEAIDKMQFNQLQHDNKHSIYTRSVYSEWFKQYGKNLQSAAQEQNEINQGLIHLITMLYEQNNELLGNKQNIRSKQIENCAKQVDSLSNKANTAKIQELIDNVEKIKREQEHLNKQVDVIKEHPINQRVNNLQVDIKNLKESIQLINNSNVSHDENHQALVNQRIDNLSDDVKIVKQSVKELSNITLIEDHPINQRVNNLHDDITNIKEFMQDLSNEIEEMKQLITKQQSTSGVQAETLHCNQQADDEEPKKFQKLIEDINNLKKIKEIQESDEEINVEEQEDNVVGETSQSAQPKFQKLIEDLSNLQKLKERKNPNENNEMMEEVKRVTGEQISKQFEDLKIFISYTLANKQNGEDEEVHNKQEKRKKKKKSSKNNY